MKILVRILLKCEVDHVLTFEQAVATHELVRKPTRMMSTQLGVLLGGRSDAAATVEVEGHGKTFINLGDNHDEDETTVSKLIIR